MNLTTKLSRRLHSIWNWLFGPRCIGCNCRGAKKTRQRTQYQDDNLNYKILCDRCQDDTDDYWDSMWEEYHKGCM